ncbi:CIA30 family protein [Halopseudomonas salegens]|uniref:Complex I intermediate-associated protein 30 (CIA30) n=1 Tax=Halopseudomonas salegens TaxID=1434072 RepID=A0A1H2E790_9GAMM|nr:CIA30 family protein [Halopseudomonas salegens]SDT91052.1 Complex I intermediate-associated protein 30 (CIA30) [Halopseudomonas salegens]
MSEIPLHMPEGITEQHALGQVQLDQPHDWQLVSDQVMGGRSQGRLELQERNGQPCVCLGGVISLDNNGGFVQIKTLLPSGVNAGRYRGIYIQMLGSGHAVDLRLKTTALQHPWQSFRMAIQPREQWQTWWLPFSDFQPHRTDARFDPAQLRSLGVVAIGEEMRVDVCVAAWGLYR